MGRLTGGSPSLRRDSSRRPGKNRNRLVTSRQRILIGWKKLRGKSRLEEREIENRKRVNWTLDATM